MPAERGYERQVAPGGTAGLPSAGADAFGAGVGEGVARLGGALEQRSAAQREAEANEELAGKSVALEQLKTETESFEATMKDGSNPLAVAGGFGHAEVTRQFFKDRATALVEGIRDTRVRQNFEQRIAAYDGDLSARATGWEAGARGKWTGDRAGEYRGAIANRLMRSDDPAALADGIGDYEEFVDGLSVAPAQKDALLREGRAAIKGDYLESWAGKNPALARGMMASGRFDDVDPAVTERALRTAEVRENQLRVAAERAKREQDAIASKAADALVQQSDAGVDVDPNALHVEAERVRATDPARAARFDRAAAGAAEAAAYGNGRATPGQITTRIAAIEAKKGWRSDPNLVARHDKLQELRDATRKIEPEFAALNFNDPAAVQRRSVESAAFAETHNGRRIVLGRDQAAELAALAQGGAGSRAQVAAMLSRLPGQDAMVALGQVAPKDAALRQAIDLPRRLRAELFSGEELRKANTALVPNKDVTARWGERGARALRGLPPEFATGVLEATKNVYAARAARAGVDAFDEDLWDRTLNDVIDPSGRGGIGEHKGAPIVLPDGMTQREFDRRWANIPEMPNVFHDDKTRIGRAELLRGYRLVPTPDDGVYHLVNGRGEFALARNRTRATVNLRRVPLPVVRPWATAVTAQAGGVALPQQRMEGPRSAYSALPKGGR